MMQKYTVSLEKIIRDHKFEVLYMPKAASDIYVSTADVNRPGLQMAGFFDYFDSQRMQIMGKVEFTYLEKLPTFLFPKTIIKH